jgi:P-loop containing NTP hydrolase pore-1
VQLLKRSLQNSSTLALRSQKTFVKSRTSAHQLGCLLEPSRIQASVRAPPITYQHHLHDRIEDGSLSCVQFEAVLRAWQRFKMLLPDGSRAGFAINDATGLGKGRQIACIAQEGVRIGEPVHVWITVNKDLQ